SATRDGHVYAATEDGWHVFHFDSNGNRSDLGAPAKGLPTHSDNSLDPGEVAASVGRYGQNEVFAIGRDGAIYVNGSNTYGEWRPVDNKAQSASLSATPNNTVSALTAGLPWSGGGGLLYQETQQYNFVNKPYYWASQYIPSSTYYTSISADID